MSTAYKPVEHSFLEELQALADQQAHTRVQYYSDIHEFLTANASISSITHKDNEPFLHMSSGEEIRLDRIVRVGTKAAPGYDEDYFKCDC